MSWPAPPPLAGGAVVLTPAAPADTGCGRMSQLNFPGRCTISVPLARSISRPCGSASVCRKVARSVRRLSRYLSSGVTAELTEAEAVAGAAATGATGAASSTVTTVSPISRTSFLRWRGRQHIACPVRLQRTDQARKLHRLQQPRRAVVANLQAPLHVGDRRLPLGRDDAHRLVVERIGFRVLAVAAAAFAVLAAEAGNRRLRAGEHLLDVVRRRRSL